MDQQQQSAPGGQNRAGNQQEHNMIKAIIFDVGGVLIRTEDPSPRLKLEERLGLPPGAAELLVFNGPQGQAAQRGEISSAALWRGIQQELDLTDQGLQDFRRAFFQGDRLNRPLLQLVRRLRYRYQTGILSNFMDDLRRILREEYPLVDAFDEIMISAEEGVMKPDPEVLHRLLARLGRQPGETVFIDDFPHNVEGAQAVGMHAIHYRPETDVAAALADLGVETGPTPNRIPPVRRLTAPRTAPKSDP